MIHGIVIYNFKGVSVNRLHHLVPPFFLGFFWSFYCILLTYSEQNGAIYLGTINCVILETKEILTHVDMV